MSSTPGARKLIALVDMDGTLCNYHQAIETDLRSIASNDEDIAYMLEHAHDEDAPQWLKNRINIIRTAPGWWYGLQPLELGFNVYNMLRHLGYETHVLTKGPMHAVSAWSEKLQWCKKHLHTDTKVTITMDKGLVYGSVLVDDYPPYALSWLKWRKNGLVVMPAHQWNNDIQHPQITRYTGTNTDEIYERLAKRKEEILGA